MMLRYAKNYIKIVNIKGWIRAPVCLLSTETNKDFPNGAIGTQKDKAKDVNLDQSIKTVKMATPPIDTPKVNTKIQFGSTPLSEVPSPPPPGGKKGDSSDDKSYKNYIWPLLITIGTLGGVYYSEVFDSFKEEKKDDKKEKKEVERVYKRIPENVNEIPNKAQYLLIGGGTASFTAFRSIKANDPKAKILVVSSENAFPYMRPPLSKEIWQYEKLPVDFDKLTFKQWNGRERSLYYEPPEFYLRPDELESSENGGVAVATGWTISRIDAENKKAYITVPGEEDKEISYDKCLIATGCRPRMLPQFSGSSEEVSSRTALFRNIHDLDNLWKKLQDPKTQTVVIVGGGFLGSELACSLGRNNNFAHREVIQIFKESGNMGKALPEYLSQWTSERVNAEGVKVMANSKIEDVSWSDGKVILRLSDDRNVSADLVILTIGCEPCTELADISNLEVDGSHGGFVVNAELEARKDLFVAGDAACFYDPVLGRRRIEHHDHAVVSGRLAGENMVGQVHKPYKHQSMFWSDLSPDLGYEAIGLVDAKLATVAVFAKNTETDSPNETEQATEEKKEEPLAINVHTISHEQNEKQYGKGIIFYLKGEKLVGIVLWNIFNRMNIARQVLAQGKTYKDLNEVAKLFNIHED